VFYFQPTRDEALQITANIGQAAAAIAKAVIDAQCPINQTMSLNCPPAASRSVVRLLSALLFVVLAPLRRIEVQPAQRIQAKPGPGRRIARARSHRGLRVPTRNILQPISDTQRSWPSLRPQPGVPKRALGGALFLRAEWPGVSGDRESHSAWHD
jgi:hypothetical protein